MGESGFTELRIVAVEPRPAAGISGAYGTGVELYGQFAQLGLMRWYDRGRPDGGVRQRIALTGKGGMEMKRIALLAVTAVLGVSASAASATPGATSAAHRAAGVTTTWTAEYNASTFYGAVKCSGKTTVNKKYPNGRDVETCETTEGKFKNMKAGKGQKAFVGTETTYEEWESDSGSGKRTTNYTYSVNAKLTKFKLVAIY